MERGVCADRHAQADFNRGSTLGSGRATGGGGQTRRCGTGFAARRIQHARRLTANIRRPTSSFTYAKCNAVGTGQSVASARKNAAAIAITQPAVKMPIF